MLSPSATVLELHAPLGMLLVVIMENPTHSGLTTLGFIFLTSRGARLWGLV